MDNHEDTYAATSDMFAIGNSTTSVVAMRAHANTSLGIREIADRTLLIINVKEQ